MKKTKTILFLIVLSTFFIVGNTVFGAFGLDNINNNLVGDENTVDVTIQSYISILIGFLYIVAILYGIYGGFKIFTAGDDDDKVKDGKKIIFQALIGIVIIFLAGPIIDLLLGNADDAGILGE